MVVERRAMNEDEWRGMRMNANGWEGMRVNGEDGDKWG